MPEDMLAELDRLVREAGLVMSFDGRRDVSICAACGMKALGEYGLGAWAVKAPGWRDQDCRLLCDRCAKLSPLDQCIKVMHAEIAHLLCQLRAARKCL